MISAKRKTRLFRKASSELVEPVLVIQLCDNNKFSKDFVVGEILMPLLGFEEGHPSEEDMVNVKYHKERNFKCCISCCVFCWRTRCCLRPEKRKKIDLPRAPVYLPNKMRCLSMFQQKSVRGWWPCLSTKVPKEQRSDYSDRKKDDDYDPYVYNF
uniref:Uncharacterized protein n=1 Tax=Panagrolaimus superbus TaxID=310955 RepID=A0A914Y095_9BILA